MYTPTNYLIDRVITVMVGRSVSSCKMQVETLDTGLRIHVEVRAVRDPDLHWQVKLLMGRKNSAPRVFEMQTVLASINKTGLVFPHDRKLEFFIRRNWLYFQAEWEVAHL